MIQPDWKDSVLCVVKIGDNGDYRDGELVEVIDPAEWDVEKFEYSDHMGKVYRGELRPLEAKDKLRQAVAYNAMQRKEFKSNIRKVVESKDAIYSAKIGAVIDATTATAAEKAAEKSDKAVMLDTAVKVGWYEKDTVVPIVDAKALADTGIVDKDFTGAAIVPDFNTISSGSYTLGSGGDYATIALFAADIVTGGISGNITGTIQSAITETASASFSRTYSNYTVKITSDTDHQGDPTAGWLVTTSQWFDVSTIGASGTLEFEKFRYKHASNGGWYINSGSTACTLKISNLIVDANNAGYHTVEFANNTGLTVEISNCNFYDVGSGMSAIQVGSQPSSLTVENCVIYSCTTNGINCNSKTGTYRNVVCHGNGTDFANPSAATGYDCAKSGAGAIGFATESGTVSGIADADFTSVTKTDANFLNIDATSDLYHVGSDGSLAGVSINGVTRVSGSWSIGAHEPEAAASTPIPVFMNHYRQMWG